MITVGAAGTLLITAFVTDIRSRKIPNGLTALFFIVGLILSFVTDGANGLLHSLLGAAAGFLPLLVLYLIRAVGAGDVKLFGAIGALLGPEETLRLLFASLMAASLVALFILVWRGELRVRGQQLLFSLFRIGVLYDREELKGVIRAEGYLRFPFMWAVLPAGLGLFFQWI